MYLVVCYEHINVTKGALSPSLILIELYGNCAFTKVNLSSYLYNSTIF